MRGKQKAALTGVLHDKVVVVVVVVIRRLAVHLHDGPDAVIADDEPELG